MNWKYWVVVAPAIFGGAFFLTLAGMDHFYGPVEPANAKQAPSLALLTIDPQEMKACEPARVGKVRWNAKRAGPEAVKIFIAVSKTQESLFVDSNDPIGQADTAQWLAAGTTFILRQSPSGKELARTEVKLQPGTC